LAESLTLPQRSACWPLDEGEQLAGLPQLFRSAPPKKRTFLLWRKRTFSFWDDTVAEIVEDYLKALKRTGGNPSAISNKGLGGGKPGLAQDRRNQS